MSRQTRPQKLLTRKGIRTMSRRTNNSNRNYRTLRFQNLEERSMKAGDVAVSVSAAGDLLIQGDTEGNEVVVVQEVTQGQAVPGSFYVSGLNGTTINGGVGTYFE